MRFRPANIRVINRRVKPGLSPVLLFNNRSAELTDANVFPLRRPSMGTVGARTVLAALARQGMRRAAPAGTLRVGSMGQEQEGQLPPAEKAGRLKRETGQRS